MAQEKKGFLERLKRHRSVLGSRIVGRIFLFAFILSLFAMFIAFILYVGSMITNMAESCYRADSIIWNSVDKNTVEQICDGVLDAYAKDKDLKSPDVPEDKYDSYLAEAEKITSDDSFEGYYDTLIEYLKYYCKETDKDRAFFAIADNETGNLIMVADSGINEDNLKDLEPAVPGLIEYEDGVFNEIEDAQEEGHYTVYVHIDMLMLRGVQYVKTEGNYTFLIGTDDALDTTFRKLGQFLLAFTLLMLIISLFLTVVLAWYFQARVITPINKLSNAARKYTEDKQGGYSNEDHFSNLKIHTKDEIQNLTDTLSSMEKEVNEYYENLLQATAEQQRMASELEIAEKIQNDALPRVFPPFPEKAKVFDIYATMDPAKEVGGDFYDFLLLDEHTLAFLIADVSGKGIPGALFMMQSKLLISTAAKKIGNDPAKILEEVNHSVMQNNAAEMFVTVWLAILDLTTGKMVCANAGHEYPFVQKAGGKFELLKDKHGFVIGGMDNVKFKNYDIQLAPGDAVFVYTDGAPEAVNVDEEMYGTDRIGEALNRDPERGMEQLLNDVKNSIDEFTKGAEQFDDITMVGLRYYGE